MLKTKKVQYPTAAELDEHIYMVHSTHILPKNGQLVPGCLLYTHNPENSLVKHKEGLRIAPEIRMTLHWCCQNLVESHSGYDDKPPIIIIERAKHLKPVLIGGYVEDFYSLGSYTLSQESIILAPENMPVSDLESLGSYSGTLRRYAEGEDVNSIVRERLSTCSKWHITIPPNQKTVIECNVHALYQAIEQNPEDKFLQSFLQQVLVAIENKQQTISLEDNCPPSLLEITADDTKIKAGDFFQAWSGTRDIGVAHSESTYGKLEVAISRATAPFRAMLHYPDAKDLFALNEELSAQSKVAIYDLAKQKEMLTQLRNMLQQLNTHLISINCPSSIIRYVQENLVKPLNTVWLKILDEDCLARESGKDSLFINTEVVRIRLAALQGDARLLLDLVYSPKSNRALICDLIFKFLNTESNPQAWLDHFPNHVMVDSHDIDCSAFKAFLKGYFYCKKKQYSLAHTHFSEAKALNDKSTIQIEIEKSVQQYLSINCTKMLEYLGPKITDTNAASCDSKVLVK